MTMTEAGCGSGARSLTPLTAVTRCTAGINICSSCQIKDYTKQTWPLENMNPVQKKGQSYNMN